MSSRRAFLQSCGALSVAASWPWTTAAAATSATAHDDSVRSYHVSLSPEGLESHTGLIETVRDAGVQHIWICGYFYGDWPYPLETIQGWIRRVEEAGLSASVINIPLGHPGDSLGSKSGQFPLSPPERWRMAHAIDGSTYSGTSLHPPAVEENAEALRRLASAGVRRVFLDDDFRLARSPGMVGGCFCEEDRREFQKAAGLDDVRWTSLVDAIQRRDLTGDVRAWVDFQCDRLTGAFRRMREAAPEIDLGIMVMYLGAEKAGIRLEDYRGSLFRVGEGMFSDSSFGSVKGKTDELFSALFHRRFTSPERAYSETTAYPADALSAPHMAAKLAISTLADVRHTMFMSGLTPVPIGHWATLGPAMKHQAALHAKVAGHRPRGPLKHYWGERSRYVGDDNPYSLFLAMGVPFEVVSTEDDLVDGMAFLSQADANDPPDSKGAALLARPGEGVPASVRAMPETLDDLFALKRELVTSDAGGVLHVEQDVPVVCAWYPTARAVLLWNLTVDPQELTVRRGEDVRPVRLDALGSALLEEWSG